LLVLTHHRIGSPAANPFYDPIYSASPEAFRAQVMYLRDRFRLLRLDELLTLGESRFSFKEPTALVTFDDGYRDNFALAFPILKDLGISATFFLPTGFLDRPRLPWWDHIAYVMKRTERPTLSLDIPVPLTINLEETPRADATWTVIRTFMKDENASESAFLAHLEARANVAVDAEALGHDLFMSWDQVQELAHAGMAIGSHSHNHPNLARLTEGEERQELTESKQVLEGVLGHAITALAYPFGETDAYTERTKRLARSAGYRLGFCARRGINRPGAIDPFDIMRVGIGYSDTSVQVRARSLFYSAFGASRI